MIPAVYMSLRAVRMCTGSAGTRRASSQALRWPRAARGSGGHADHGHASPVLPTAGLHSGTVGIGQAVPP